MTYIIRAATLEDAFIIAPLLRESDKNEIKALIGWGPKTALSFSIQNSDKAYIAFRSDGTPLSIFGVGGSEESGGIPWMVATDELKRSAKDFIRLARVWIKGWMQEYNTLSNYVDSRNTVHINWLTHMGFTVVEEPHYIGKDPDVPFYFFFRRDECASC